MGGCPVGCPGGDEVRTVLDALQGSRDAIRGRAEQNADYRAWLEQFGRDVLKAVL